jgi:putative hemolysin
MEDLLEEIVGQIYDEYDRPESAGAAPPLATATVTAPVIPGGTEVSDLNRNYGLRLDDTDYTTIGGVVFGKLGRLPRVGDRVELPGAAIEVVEMEGRRVGKVRLTLAHSGGDA